MPAPLLLLYCGYALNELQPRIYLAGFEYDKHQHIGLLLC